MRSQESNIIDLMGGIRPQLYEAAKALADLYDSGRKNFRMGTREDLKDLMTQVNRALPYSPFN